MSRKIAPYPGLIAVVFAVAWSAAAQIAPPPPDPLARIRAAAANNPQVCSVSETSACAQANPKILAAAMSSPALAENVRQLKEIGPREMGTPGLDRAIIWALAAFRDSGADAVSTETGYTDPAIAAGEKNVIAEIRGREKPDEFVIMAAKLDEPCNAALVVEAARDIHLTGLRPRRSIRFVLFSSANLAPWAYARKHRSELDRASTAVMLEDGCGAITGFDLVGREELGPGVRQALDFDPIKSWGIAEDTFSAPSAGGYLDFFLEGVPSLTANRNRTLEALSAQENNLDTLKKNTAVAGILAFGLAERAMPLGSRLSRTEIERLLNRTGVDARMHSTFVDMGRNTGASKSPAAVGSDLWHLWETGQRGRER